MADQAKRDQNHVTSTLFVGSDGGTYNLEGDEATGRIYVDLAGGSGTVTSVSVVSANGFAGSVADATTTPAITLSTTVNSPILAGNGTAISAATTTGSGSTAVLATAPTFPTNITVGAAAGATGDILLKGLTSGTVTLTVADVAGTWTLQLPANDGDAGQVLTTDGNGVTTWETPAGGGTISGTIAATQVAFGTGVDEIGGDAGLTYDSVTDLLTVAGDVSVGDDLLLASSGAVINFNSGDVTITHAANLLTLAGGDFALGTNLRLLPGGDSASQIYWDGSSLIVSTVSLAAPLDLQGSSVRFRSGGSNKAVLSTSSLGADRTFTFPDATGTFALADNVALITVANEATDTTCFPLFTTAATGNLQPKTNTNLTFDSNTGDLRVINAGTNTASVVTVGGTQTLTSKRITKRTGTTTSSATPTINTDNVDEYYITAQAEDITSFTTNLSGTPTLGQLLFISVIGTAARGITWGASFANGPVALPTTTVTTTQLSTLLKWDGSIWRCYATGSTV